MNIIHRAEVNIAIAEIRFRRRYLTAVQAVKWLYWKAVLRIGITNEWIKSLNWPVLIIVTVLFLLWVAAVGFIRIWLVKELQ